VKRILGTADRCRILSISLCALGCASLLSGCKAYSPVPQNMTPTSPTNLVATAVSNSQINLTWTTSTETGGSISGYLVERCQGAGCSNFAQIAAPTTTSYNDTGLSASTSYSYRVRATDAANNLGPYSSVASGTTLAPQLTAPSNLVATPASGSQINLTWTTSTETGGTISKYLVERCQGTGCSNFAQIAAPTTTSYNDTGLDASTSYSYRVRATDAANNLSAYSNVASGTTLAAPAVGVSIKPVRGGAVVGQSVTFTAAVQNDVGAAGVTWSTSGGSFSSQSTTSANLVAPNAAGSVTVTATSVANNTVSASATIGITDLTGVTTWRYDNTRAGANTHEFALTTSNVNTTTFGKLFSCAVDAPIYAEPLWVANLSIGGGTHNVIFAATVHDTVYAFDADASPCKTYWQKSLLGTGETWVSSNDVNTSDITPDIGIIGTPVIDPTRTTLYVVSKSEVSGSGCTPASSCHQRIHALNLTNGTEKFSGPTEISATVTGTGDGSSGGMVTFDSLTQNQRPALTYLNGTVYIAWASHGDNSPYHGWIIGYNATNLTQQTTVFNADPDGGQAGIWMSANGLAADASNNLYCVTGNGTFDGTLPPVAGADDFGDSVLKLSTSAALSLADFFTPSNQSSLNSGDTDLGSGGVVILPDQSNGGPVHLLFISSKSGKIYLINRDNLGQFNSSTDQVVQEFVASGGGFWSTPAFWQNTMYAGGSGDNIIAWPFNHNTPGQFDATSSSSSASGFGFPGASPAVSANGATNGIVWAIDSSAYGVPCCANGPAILHAYDATNLANELWNSGQVAADQVGNAVKFTVPMVANGKVYIGTISEISVYGLKPQ
jgi:fibronectin type 3 domain-containing protein